jgi:hypothetical protein
MPGAKTEAGSLMRSLLLALLGALVALPAPAKEKPPVSYRIPLPPRPDFEPLDWLVGEWTGKTSERSPQGEIRLTVSYDLEKRFMIFREEVSFSPTPTVPATNESWLGILSSDPAGKGFLLRVFSNTGFITRYRATVERGQVSLNPEGGEDPPAGWLFRRTLQRLDVGEISETVQVAPPNRSFFDYYTAKLARVGAPAAAPPPPDASKSAQE